VINSFFGNNKKYSFLISLGESTDSFDSYIHINVL
jgi:tRNA U55 pseudouridine synthase TruB